MAENDSAKHEPMTEAEWGEGPFYVYAGHMLERLSQCEFTLGMILCRFLAVDEMFSDAITYRLDLVRKISLLESFTPRKPENKGFLDALKAIKKFNDEIRLPLAHGLWTMDLDGTPHIRYVTGDLKIKTMLETREQFRDASNNIERVISYLMESGDWARIASERDAMKEHMDTKKDPRTL